IIQNLNQIAKKVNGESVLLTFEPHPKVVLQKDFDGLQLLTTLEEKIESLKKAGLQNLIVHPFTKAFSEFSSEEFVKDFLIDQIGIHTLVIGYNHHFGKNREGNFAQLLGLSEKFDFHLKKIEEVKSENKKVSSTQIRKALLNGNLEFAKNGLGRNYFLSGKVVHGDKLGRTLGFPTANLEVEKYKLIPGNGVYLVKVHLGKETFKGLLSIGTRPTVTNSQEKRTEVYILDFDRNIYDETLSVEFLHKIRDDKKFDSMEELVKEMNADKKFAEQYFL
ncbi:MAG TPA: bifunctional riboflavin kinase/FAD synthetase, partial [Moheibacter sp.]|nr:bifunctional riboflavin kinase/FAD synthetase [Moheibacter sp.]